MNTLKKYLFTPIDNSALIVFRMIFGFLITCEAWGAIATGWVRRVLVEPEFTFNFIGFDFLQSFPGPGPHMYVWFAVMGVFGVMVMVGYKYRVAMVGYAVLWTTVYLMQKSSYNNHYYLLMLLCWIFAFLPAHRAVSFDAKRSCLPAGKVSESVRSTSMPRWITIFIIVQLFIVYTYGSIAKIYPDWLDTTAPRLLMLGKKEFWLVGEVLQKEWTHWIMAYFGILFDGLIIPALLWKRTRKLALYASVFFHLFNSFVFQVGIFPYMSLGFIVFFYPPKTIHRIFLKKWKDFYNEQETLSTPVFTNTWSGIGIVVATIYLVIQALLPLRQHTMQDSVLWTEEGHRLSWRMMLRTKQGSVSFSVVDKETNKKTFVKLTNYLTPKQRRNLGSKPDFIWQFAQRLKKEYAAKGQDIAVFVNCRVKVNGRKYKRLVDPKVDLTTVDWDFFKHADWLLDSEGYLEK